MMCFEVMCSLLKRQHQRRK